MAHRPFFSNASSVYEPIRHGEHLQFALTDDVGGAMIRALELTAASAGRPP